MPEALFFVKILFVHEIFERGQAMIFSSQLTLYRSYIVLGKNMVRPKNGSNHIHAHTCIMDLTDYEWDKI